MFTTYEPTKMPLQISSNGEVLWPYVELSINCPWFICEYEILFDDHSIISIRFFTNIEHIKALNMLERVKLISVYLVSPSYLNSTDEWKMNKLERIQFAELNYKGSNLPIYKYVMSDGGSFIHNVTGLGNKSEKDLVFTDILVC